MVLEKFGIVAKQSEKTGRVKSIFHARHRRRRRCMAASAAHGGKFFKKKTLGGA
jgi:hypothetical protein